MTAPPNSLLIVDDDPMIADLLDFELSECGYQTLTAASAAEALELLAQHASHIGCILSDYRMPEMNGLEFARAVKQTYHLPFVMISGMAGLKLRDLNESGVSILVSKPFDLDMLTRLIVGNILRAPSMVGERQDSMQRQHVRLQLTEQLREKVQMVIKASDRDATVIIDNISRSGFGLSFKGEGELSLAEVCSFQLSIVGSQWQPVCGRAFQRWLQVGADGSLRAGFEFEESIKTQSQLADLLDHLLKLS